MNDSLSPESLRTTIRSGEHTRPTCGLAPGYVQANLVILPRSWAFDFLLYCQRNPKPCPLLEVVEAGSVAPARLAPGADLRIDVPRYRVFRKGVLTDEPTDISAYWQDDFVSFLLGCSFSFDQRLIDAGLEVRNVAEGVNVSMYRTNIPTRPAGAFRGPLVVSMRPFKPADALRATLISAELPQVHGAPVHVGNPPEIGITDLHQPDYGDPVTLHEGEQPLFWACGVTPQGALLCAQPPLAITHAPGHMFVTDLPEAELTAYSERLN